MVLLDIKNCFCGESERRLLQKLLENYTVEERPCLNDSDSVKVQFTLSLRQIIDLNEVNQVITTYMWMDMYWTDHNLVWDPKDYNGLGELSLKKEEVWTPDILLYNSAHEDFVTIYPSNVLVSHTGLAHFIPPGIFQSNCKIDVTWFPFDDQSCLFTFSSWTYNIQKLDVVFQDEINPSTMLEYNPSGEWQLLGFPATKDVVDFGNETGHYSVLSYHLNIRRRTMYYFSNLIWPCIVIALLAILGFLTPPDCGEKLTLEISILMALIFYMNMVSSMVPLSSDTPLIGIYFSCIMIMVANSVGVTILILNFHHRLATGADMPKTIKQLFLIWLPWILRMSLPGQNEVLLKTALLEEKIKKLGSERPQSQSLINNILDMEEDYLSHFDSGYLFRPQQQPVANSSSSSRNQNFNGFFSNNVNSNSSILFKPSKEQIELIKIVKELKCLTKKIKDDETASLIESQWKLAAMVLDRLSLVLFLVLSVVLTIAIGLAAPQVFVW